MQPSLGDSLLGLSSRFDPKAALMFEDFSDEELLEVVSAEFAAARVPAPIRVKLHAVQMLAKRRNMANFGNARDAKSIVSTAKQRLSARLEQSSSSSSAAGGGAALTFDDLDPDFAAQSDPERALEEIKSFGQIEVEMRELGTHLGSSRACLRMRSSDLL